MIDPATGLDTPDVSTTTPHQGIIGRLFSSYLAGSAGGGMTNGIGNAFANTNMGQDINNAHQAFTGNTTPLIGSPIQGQTNPSMPSKSDVLNAYKQKMGYTDPYQSPYGQTSN